MTNPKPIPKKEILRLCELLDEDPEMVSQITIHPAYLIVEHIHPIWDDRPKAWESQVTEHEVTND